MAGTAGISGGKRAALPLTWASAPRLLSVHEGGWIVDARVSTFLRRLDPAGLLSGTRDYHRFDLVILGDNPLLAAILLSLAVARGLDVAVTLPAARDPWPYDLASSREAASLLRSVAGRDGPAGTRGPATLRAVRSLVSRAGARACVLDASELEASARNPPGELTLYPRAARVREAMGAEQSELASEFRAAAAGMPVARVRPKRGTAVFAGAVVLTAMPRSMTAATAVPGGFGSRIVWESPLVRAVGTAAHDPCDGISAAGMMVDDILRCARGLPLEGLAAAGIP